MSHEQLTLKRRFRLEIWGETDMSQEEIAHRLRIHPSTVSREYARNGGRIGYDAKQAHARARKRRAHGKRLTKKLSVDPDMYSLVEELLTATLSPEQIAGVMRMDGVKMVCHETIYRYIYKERPEWKRYLRQKKGRSFIFSHLTISKLHDKQIHREVGTEGTRFDAGIRLGEKGERFFQTVHRKLRDRREALAYRVFFHARPIRNRL
jgi:IS30 family transposase